MSFRKALLGAWCAWLGVLVIGSVLILLLDKPEWRQVVGILSILVGFLAFFCLRRFSGRSSSE
jgi:O-antigen/teichoic acid export membrane protein